jgi:hypothetical protein
MLRTSAASLELRQADVEAVHDPDFRQAEKDWFSLVGSLTERLVEIDDTVPELPVKDIVSCGPGRPYKTQGTNVS